MARVKIDGGAWRIAMPNSTLLGLIIGRRIPINTSCGHGTCGSDMVVIVAGEENLTPMTNTERQTLEAIEAPANARLACATKIIDGDVEIVVPEESLR